MALLSLSHSTAPGAPRGIPLAGTHPSTGLRGLVSPAVVGIACSYFLYALWTLSGAGGAEARSVVGNLSYVAFGVLAGALACRQAVRSGAGRVRWGWLLIAAGLLANAAGNASWSVIELVLRQSPFPSAADAFFILCAPLIAVGVLRLSGPRLSQDERVDLALDSGTVLIAGVATAWTFLIPLHASGGDQPALARALTAYYPFASSATLAAACFSFLRSPEAGRDRTLLPLIAACGVFSIGWLVYSYVSLMGDYQSGHPIDAVINGGIALFALAALPRPERPSQAAASVPVARHRILAHRRAGSWLIPHAAGVPVYVLLLLLLHGGAQGATLVPCVVALMAITAAVSARQVRTAREARRAEDELRRAEAMYRSIVHGATEGIFQIDAGGTIVTANPALRRMLGLAPDGERGVGVGAEADGVGNGTANLLSVLRGAGGDEPLAQLLATRASLQGYECQAIRPDGQMRWVAVNAHRIPTVPGTRTNEPDHDAQIARHEPSGSRTGYCYEGTVTDVTDRREAERERLEAARLGAALAVVRTVAHDINNALSPITGGAELLRLDPEVARHPSRSAYLTMIEQGAESVAEKVRRLGAIVRLEERPCVLGSDLPVLDMERSTAARVA